MLHCDGLALECAIDCLKVHIPSGIVGVLPGGAANARGRARKKSAPAGRPMATVVVHYPRLSTKLFWNLTWVRLVDILVYIVKGSYP